MLFSRFFFPLALAALLVGCGSPEPSRPAAPPKPPAPPPVPGPSLTALTDSSAPAELLAYGRQYPASEVIIKTRLGNIRVRLYDDTPIHRANFLLLARKGVFDETQFNRVVKGFAIQGGQGTSRRILLHPYHLPPEIRPQHFHHRGALGMARYDDAQNPGHLSSNTDFYIVVGEKLQPYQAQAMAGRRLSPAQLRRYASTGGVPSLDGKYTVFGEVLDGLDVVEKISQVQVNPQDKWPDEDVNIKMEVVR